MKNTALYTQICTWQQEWGIQTDDGSLTSGCVVNVVSKRGKAKFQKLGRKVEGSRYLNEHVFHEVKEPPTLAEIDEFNSKEECRWRKIWLVKVNDPYNLVTEGITVKVNKNTGKWELCKLGCLFSKKGRYKTFYAA